MKTIQSMLSVSILTLLLGISVQAQAAPSLQPNTLSAHDLELLFEQDGQPMQFALLSEQEMKETKGAIWPFVTNWVSRLIWGGHLGGVVAGVTVLNNPYEYGRLGRPKLFAEYITLYSILGLVSTRPSIGFIAGVTGVMHSGGLETIRKAMRENDWTLPDLVHRVGEAVDQVADGTFDRVEPYSMSSNPSRSDPVPFLVGLTSRIPETELRQFFSSLPDRRLNQLLIQASPGTDRDQFLADLTPELVNQVLVGLPDRYMRDFVRIVPASIMNPIFNSAPTLRAYWSG